MKKILSVLMIFIILFNCFPVAFATNETADEDMKIEDTYEEDDFDDDEDWEDDCPEESFSYGSISLGETLSLDVGQNVTYRLSVTVPETGVYILSSADAQFGVEAVLYDAEDNYLSGEQGWNDFRIPYELEAGKTYYYTVQFCDDWDEGSFDVSLNKGLHCDFGERHSFTDYKYNNDATEYLDGTKTAYCDYGCGEEKTITAIGTALNPTIIDLELNERKTVTLKPGTGVIFRITSEHNWFDGDEYWIETICDTDHHNKIRSVFYYDESYGILDGGMGRGAYWGFYEAPIANKSGHIYYISEFNTSDKETTYSKKLLLESERHNYVLEANGTPRSCVEDGIEKYVCSDCGTIRYGDPIPATGECVYKPVRTYDATCVDGYTQYECECGNGYKGDIIPATGEHDWQKQDYDGATCYSDGETTYWCSICNDEKAVSVPNSKVPHRFYSYAYNENGSGDKVAYCCFCYEATDTVPATESSKGFDFYVSDSKVTIFYCSDSEVVIPDTLFGYPVTAIANYPFRECEVTSVTIPASVTDIAPSVFSYCDWLEKITISSDNKNYITDEYGVLYNKDKTVLVKYPSGIENTTYVIPDSVRTINQQAFSNATNLEHIVFGKNVEVIGESAFRYCENLRELNLPLSLKEIDRYAFEGASSIKEIIIPDSVTNLGRHAFATQGELERIVIGSGIKVVPAETFCDAVEELIIPESVEKIEAHAFEFIGWINHLCYEGTLEQWNNIKNSTVDELLNNVENFHPEYTPGTMTVRKEPTCTKIGYEGIACTCGYSLSGEIVHSKDHTYSEYISDNNATCTEDGTKTAVCINDCDKKHTVTDKSSAKGHDFTAWVNNEEASTATRGCKNCDYTETVPLINQDDGDVEIIAPENPDCDFEIDEIKPSEEDSYILIKKIITDNLGTDWELLKAFDITLKNHDGVHVQPNGTIKVKLPLDWEKDGIYKVYRINDDGSLTDMNAYRQGSHMIFDTDHFSVYVIVYENSNSSAESPEQDASCTCSCHKGGISGFFWKILRFFYKIFGMKKYCDCGVSHY